MTIRLDCTSFSVVAVCSACGWRAGAQDRTDGWRLARAHERNSHPGSTQALRALDSLTRARQ